MAVSLGAVVAADVRGDSVKAPLQTIPAHDVNECSSSWDLVVIGGGPAGAAAAITAARHGLRTLIADRSEHPRPKVCGCCLSPLAIERLNALGVSAIAAHGEQLHTVQVDCLGMLTKWQRSGVALSRARLDSELLHMAAAAGASVMTGVVAEAQPSGIVTLRKGGMSQQLNARLVVAADGIGGSSLRSSERLRWRTLPRSRIGFGALLAHEAIDIQAGELLMCVRAGGYIGAVAIGGGIVDVAAAAEPAVVRAAGGPAALTIQWLGRRIRDRERVIHSAWTGTPRLTRRRAAATDGRIIASGDALGYVEPFTGEGIGWALASGIAAANHADLVLSGRTSVDAWERTARRMSAWSHARCASMALLVRAPRILAAVLRVGQHAPMCAAYMGRAWGVQRTNALLGSAGR